MDSLEPEWRKEEDVNGRYSSAISKNPRTYYSPLKKVPLRFGRSKSTPQLMNVEPGAEGSQNKEKKIGDVFTMLKEANSFDRNFPTLNPPAKRGSGVNGSVPNVNQYQNLSTLSNNKVETTSLPSGTSSVINITPVSSATTPLSAWQSSSRSPNKIVPLNGNGQLNGNPTAQSGRDGSETDLQLASCIVPTVQPPKVLAKNRVELLGPNKKKFDMLRKATSDPNLPIPAAYQAKYATLIATKQGVTDKEKIKDKPAEKKIWNCCPQ